MLEAKTTTISIIGGKGGIFYFAKRGSRQTKNLSQESVLLAVTKGMEDVDHCVDGDSGRRKRCRGL